MSLATTTPSRACLRRSAAPASASASRARAALRAPGAGISAPRPALSQARRLVISAAGSGMSEDELMSAISDLGQQPKTWDVTDDLRSPGTSEGSAVEAQGGEPKTCAEAIDKGLAIYRAGGYEDALVYFQQALELPGTGLVRFRGKPPGPSAGEEMAAYYNQACVYARTGDVRAGLVALNGCLDAGYDEYDQIRSDPDLDGLKGDPKFEAIIVSYQPKGLEAMFLGQGPSIPNPFGKLFGGDK